MNVASPLTWDLMCYSSSLSIEPLADFQASDFEKRPYIKWMYTDVWSILVNCACPGLFLRLNYLACTQVAYMRYWVLSVSLTRYMIIDYINPQYTP